MAPLEAMRKDVLGLARSLEIMVSSMNGLSVGDSVADSIMDSPVRLENASCFRDEMIVQYSPMSEESDDYRYYDNRVNTNGSQTDATSSPSTSPISSPHRFQKPHSWFPSASPYPLPSCSLSAVVCAHARRGSGTEHEGRIPSSPNDMCHGGDLRRTALLRSVQMRVQIPRPCDLLSRSGEGQEQERDHVHADDLEHGQKPAVGVQLDQRSSSHPKSIQNAEYQSPTNCGLRSDHDVDFVEAPRLIMTTSLDSGEPPLGQCGWAYIICCMSCVNLGTISSLPMAFELPCSVRLR